MSKATVVAALIALMIGVAGGFVWWGLPTGRLQGEIRDARGNADRLAQQLDDLRNREQQLAAQLAAQKTRLEAAERDLRTEREMNRRLHLVISQGKK